MRLTLLSSGSGGNTLCIESEKTCIYVDAGLQRHRLRERWQRVQAMRGGSARLPASAVFLTHEHGDHIAGADDLAAQGLSLYATAGTAAGARLSARGRGQVRELGAGAPLVHGDLSVLPVTISHDAAEPVAFVFSDGRRRLGVITDCGQPSDALARAFADCDALILETNHDRGLLVSGPYPERLKRRIASGAGHLSNAQSADLLRAILGCSRTRPALLVCAHLSKVNNRPELALRAMQTVLGQGPTQLLVAAQDDPMGPIELGQALPAAQLSLALGPAALRPES